MSTEDLTLVKLTRKWEQAFREFAADYRAENPEGFSNIDDFDAYLDQLYNMEHGIDLPDWMVPQADFWLVRDSSDMLGRVTLRDRLTPNLELVGGHIGYMIRPTERRKGYGTKILELALPKAREMGLDRVLITCKATNTASAKIIEKNGGVRTSDSINPDTDGLHYRYWIDL